MAEFVSGSEELFVQQMNERAKSLGMEQTHFVNCNGLDADGHVTSARDIALMSQELITNHPEIHEYCMIWMENITHNTAKGSSEFGLTNTNKLVRQYEYTTGLKTGSTGNAKFCVSATAEKNGVELIAVVMAAEDSKSRFKDAVSLLNYGFGVCQLYRDEEPPVLKEIAVKGGVEESVEGEYEQFFSFLDTENRDFTKIQKTIHVKEPITAPVKKGEVIGSLIYSLGEEEIGSVNIISKSDVKKAGFLDVLKKTASLYFGGKK